MKLCIVQTRPITGDIQGNIEDHKRFIDLAIAYEADIIIFPELSLTGYEPGLANALAIHRDDRRFEVFQTLSDAGQITIGAGVPTKNRAGICISMLLFQPHQARQLYSKWYLHADEEPFFVSGQNFTELIIRQTDIALAICYELSVPEHAAQAHNQGANIYIASVAKFADGVDKAVNRLADIAAHYAMTVCMSNSVGQADGGECAGQTSVWHADGSLIRQLNDTQTGLIIFDTETQALIEKTLRP